MMEQIEFANVVLLNKTDLLTKEDAGKVEAFIRKINPKAEVIRTEHSKADLKQVLNTKLFSFDEARQDPNWLKEARGTHVPETEEYGISSIVYRARRPFHPGRLEDLLATGFKGILRAKGYCWLSSSMTRQCIWNQSGVLLDLQPGAVWKAALQKEDWENHDDRFGTGPTLLTDGEEVWQEPYGDRRQEIVFIGENVVPRRSEIEKTLDSCLLTRNEMKGGPEKWLQIEDCIAIVDNTLPEDEEEESDEEDDSDDEEESDEADSDGSDDDSETASAKSGAGAASSKSPAVLRSVCDATSFEDMEKMCATSAKGVVWERGAHKLETKLTKWVAAQDKAKELLASQQVPVPALAADIQAACKRVVSCLPTWAHSSIVNDAVALSSMLMRVVPDEQVLTVALEIVGSNSCQLWHQDAGYTTRAIITYTGPGTWMVNDAFVKQKEFGRSFSTIPGDVDLNAINLRRVKLGRTGTIRKPGPNSVGMIKVGELHFPLTRACLFRSDVNLMVR
jgi:hypothetical protein